MEHMAEVLRTADEALCTAYMHKTGMSREDALNMMEQETWLNADYALERRLIDGIMFAENEPIQMTAGLLDLPTAKQMDAARILMRQTEISNALANITILELEGVTK